MGFQFRDAHGHLLVLERRMMLVKNRIMVLLLIVGMLPLSGCIMGGPMGGRPLFSDTGQKADARLEKIVSAIKNKDEEELKSLFSNKALDEDNDIGNEIGYLFGLLQGDIVSWERDSLSSDESIQHGKRSLMIRFSFDIKTDKDLYRFFVIDFNVDTIEPDNQGIYMLELIEFTDTKDLNSWQDRMRAGIYIH